MVFDSTTLIYANCILKIFLEMTSIFKYSIIWIFNFDFRTYGALNWFTVIKVTYCLQVRWTKLVRGGCGNAILKSGLVFSWVLLLNYTHNKPEIEIVAGCAIENYDFVTKNSSFCDFCFEIGPSLMSAIFKKWASWKWSRSHLVNHPP